MGGADLVLLGDVYTVDAARRWARALAITGDRITAVGTEAEVREAAGPSAEVVRGAMILPGFQDAHIHPAFGGRNVLHVNLDDLESKTDYLARIEAAANADPDEPWIIGGGWLNVVFASTEGPRREDLDAIVPDRPVFLLNNDVHAAWVNTKALELAGVTDTTPDPWDGYFVRDEDGSPTGCLQEGTAYDFLRNVVPKPDVQGWVSCVRRAQRELHALGITGWQDAWVEPDLLRAYREFDDAGELTARVVAALWWDRHRRIEQVEGFVDQREWGTGGNVHATAVKIMLDGCPESSTASMLQPFEGGIGKRHGTGIQFLEPEPLTEAVVRLDALGFQVHQHALGDRAVRTALDAIQAARQANGWNDLRHHIAHLQLPDPSDLPRLAQVGAVANMQPYWAQPDPMISALTEPLVGADRIARLYPIGTIRATGAVLCFGSDWPVSTPNPWLELEVAVTRKTPGDPESEPLRAEEGIDLQAALAAFTRGSAYVNHDDDAGSIEVGRRADVVVVDRNPFEPDGGPIGETRTLMTIAAGRVVYDAG